MSFLCINRLEVPWLRNAKGDSSIAALPYRGGLPLQRRPGPVPSPARFSVVGVEIPARLPETLRRQPQPDSRLGPCRPPALLVDFPECVWVVKKQKITFSGFLVTFPKVDFEYNFAFPKVFCTFA